MQASHGAARISTLGPDAICVGRIFSLLGSGRGTGSARATPRERGGTRGEPQSAGQSLALWLARKPRAKLTMRHHPKCDTTQRREWRVGTEKPLYAGLSGLELA